MTSTADVHRTTRDAIRALGFDEFSFLVHTLPVGINPDLSGHLSFAVLDEAWLQIYDANGWIHVDPVMLEAARRITPVTWTMIEVSRHWQDLPAARQALIQKAREFGYTNGAAIPLHGPAGTFCTLSVLTRRDVADFSAFWSLREHLLVALARQLQEWAVSSVYQDISPEMLTPREQQVLTACATGRDAKQIALHLGASKYTIEKHLQNIQQKLGTRNKTHSVAVAISKGLIRPNGYQTGLLPPQ
jgi:DNA-binding CsgD family transcriptional regulator